MDDDAFGTARIVACTYPGCGYQARTRAGRTIHQSMRGHQPPRDSVERGDGPQPVLRVRGPAKAAEVPEEQNLDQQDAGTMAREDHPAYLRIRDEVREEPVRLADRILRLVKPDETDDGEESESLTADAAPDETNEVDPADLAQTASDALGVAAAALGQLIDVLAPADTDDAAQTA